MNMIRAICLFWLVACCCFSTAIAQGPAERSTFTDGTGVEVAYGQRAQRIVSLAPNMTEMLCFLDLEDKLVGRSDYCNFPAQIKNVPSVGGFADASLERIIALKPDLVVAYQGNDRELVDQLRQANITVIAFAEAKSLRDIFTTMSVLYRVAALPDQLPAKLGAWNKRLHELEVPVEVDRPAVFFGYPGEMSSTCGPDTFLDDLISRAGGSNVVNTPGQRWPMVSAEFITGARPDWIISATSCTGRETVEECQRTIIDQIKGDSVWSKLAAVKQGRILIVDSDLLLRPGPRILDALEQVRTALHPELK